MAESRFTTLKLLTKCQEASKVIYKSQFSHPQNPDVFGTIFGDALKKVLNLRMLVATSFVRSKDTGKITDNQEKHVKIYSLK